MILKEDKIHYTRNLKFGINISLVIAIILFFVFPDIKNESNEIPYFPEPIISIADIPSTSHSSLPSPPRPAVPLISNLYQPIDEPEALPDLELRKNNISANKEGNSKGRTTGNQKGVYEASSLPFIPRQILEVVPQKISGFEGLIKVKVLIGIDGYVKQYKVINSSTESELVINNVLEAITKSRWQPITFDGQKIEYWIEKTYTFN